MTIPRCPVVNDLCPGDSRGVLCLTSCGAETPPLMPGGESTSARLRRVEQERDELAQRVTALEQARAVWDQHHVAVCRERDLARAELASARQELEQLRAQLAAAHTATTITWRTQGGTDG